MNQIFSADLFFLETNWDLIYRPDAKCLEGFGLPSRSLSSWSLARLHSGPHFSPDVTIYQQGESLSLTNCGSLDSSYQWAQVRLFTSCFLPFSFLYSFPSCNDFKVTRGAAAHEFKPSNSWLEGQKFGLAKRSVRSDLPVRMISCRALEHKWEEVKGMYSGCSLFALHHLTTKPRCSYPSYSSV